jgi:dinuclear metal center YbgI/SA1388 family protein
VLSLDATREAYDLCVKENAGLLITHHPLFFPSIGSIDYTTPMGALVRDFIRKDICVYSAHTNLDKAQGGVNYALAEAVGLSMPMSITGVSYGLCGDLADAATFFTVAGRVRKTLGGGGSFLNMDQDIQIARVFVSSGAFDGSIISELAKAHVDLLISGEIKHHHMLELRAYGIAALAVGHDASERVVLPTLEKRLHLQFPGLGVAIAGGLDYNNMVF